MDTDDIIRVGRCYAAHRRLTMSTVSTYAVNDGKWLPGLERGTGCTLRKAATAMQWFSDHWPDDLEWPRDIPRPARTQKTKGAA